MDWRLLVTTFGLVFLAELGDKTQLAAITLTGNTGKGLTVFLGGALALVTSTLLAVLVGEALLKVVPPIYIKRIGGVLFLVIGILMIWGKFKWL